MGQEPNEKRQFLAKFVVVVLICLITAASLTLLMLMSVQAHYSEFNRDTWFGFVLPPALWAGFCGLAVWIIWRLMAVIGRPASAKTFGIASFCVFGIIGLAFWILYTS